MTRKTLLTTLLASGAFGGMTANEQRLGRFIRDGEGHPTPTPAPAPAAAAPETPPATEPTPDAFADAFAEHSAEPAPAAPAGAPAAEPAPAAPAPDSAPAADGPGAAPAAPAATPPAAAPAPAADGSAPAPVAPPAKTPADDILERLAARLEQPPAAPAAPAAPAQEPVQQSIYTPEEIGTLTEYEKNWPDVAKAEQLRRKAEYHDLTKYIFEQFVQYVTPMQQQLATVGNTMHVQELSTKVPNYSAAEEDAVMAWVETQPSYLQDPYKRVMQGGTSDEVADLIGRYRAASGVAPAAPAPAAPAAPAAAPAPAPAAPAKSELSSAAMQAVASLAPVGGERTIIPQGEDKGDFSSAFSKYATVD